MFDQAWTKAEAEAAKTDAQDAFHNALVYVKYGFLSNARMSFDVAMSNLMKLRELNNRPGETK